MADSRPSSTNSHSIACPCCGYATLDERGGWDICRICWWEDDGQDNHNATVVTGGPNSNISLARARLNFISHGIFQPSRDDLHNNQDPVDGVTQLRKFLYSSSEQTLCEPGSGWHVSIAQLDDDARRAYLSIGDAILYRRRYLDTATLVGMVQTVNWDAKMNQWTYRLVDAESIPVGKTFTAADLEFHTVSDGE
ncbi:CPCC family cysteine-rich protein [Novipirellula sp. SH528]|uniref:CPCC family cysteine-rich protein n=1 Tax=Novipirellula sp. SH528 TaxID=3454466 RepID=UPI003FA031A4